MPPMNAEDKKKWDDEQAAKMKAAEAKAAKRKADANKPDAAKEALDAADMSATLVVHPSPSPEACLKTDSVTLDRDKRS